MDLRLLIACTALVAAGCQRDSGAPSTEQNRELDEAGKMLNDVPANLEEIDDSALLEGNGPAEAGAEEPR